MTLHRTPHELAAGLVIHPRCDVIQGSLEAGKQRAQRLAPSDTDRFRLEHAQPAERQGHDVGVPAAAQAHGVEANIVNGPAPSYPVR